MSQMYNNLANLAIAKTRYSFRKGYMKVSLEDKNEVRQEIMKILGISSLTHFSRVLNNGIVNIRLPYYDAITKLFAQRNITDVWTITEE